MNLPAVYAAFLSVLELGPGWGMVREVDVNRKGGRPSSKRKKLDGRDQGPGFGRGKDWWAFQPSVDGPGTSQARYQLHTMGCPPDTPPPSCRGSPPDAQGMATTLGSGHPHGIKIIQKPLCGQPLSRVVFPPNTKTNTSSIVPAHGKTTASTFLTILNHHESST